MQKLVYTIHKLLYDKPFHINFTKSNVMMNGQEIFHLYFFLYTLLCVHLIVAVYLQHSCQIHIGNKILM
jgi:hypothetical protein